MEGTMPSWTKPTLDRLIIRLNASKSINYATPTWNKHICLTRNSVETNTHVSTLHSMIRKQLSKIGQSTEWHFNTQSPVGVQISLRYSTLKCTRLTSPQYPVAHPGHQQLSCWTWHGWPESSHSSLPHKKIIVMIFRIQVHKSAIQHKCKNEIHNGNKSLASYKSPHNQTQQISQLIVHFQIKSNVHHSLYVLVTPLAKSNIRQN